MRLPDFRPIFIGGCSRSGTTHLGAILGAHSQCVCVPESQFTTETFRSASASHDDRRLALAILDTPSFALWGLDASSLRAEIEAMDGPYPALLQSIIRRYAEKVKKGDARVWVDHTPSNVRSAVTLLQMFPTAKFLHLVRDGRGVAASVLPLDWGPNTIERAAHWWVEELAFGLALESWGGARVMRIRYEDLVGSPEETVPAIAAFCDLVYEPAMLRGDGFGPLPDSEHPLVGSPSDPDRATRWRATLTPRQIEIFESVTLDLLAYLGYPLCVGLRARPTSKRERLRSTIEESLRDRLLNRRRYRRRVARRLQYLRSPG